MRVSDDRYTRDRQRYDLAVRLIRHEARTHTIKEWTGLSDDRIRKLYRSYCRHDAAGAVTRHRGRSPRQAGYFFRNPEVRFQAANLASVFLLYGLLRAAPRGVESSYRLGSLESGALLCICYETYRELCTPATISFEHAWFLLLALGRRSELALARCSECGGVGLFDVLAKHGAPCLTCRIGSPPEELQPNAAGMAPRARPRRITLRDTSALLAGQDPPANDPAQASLAP